MGINNISERSKLRASPNQRKAKRTRTKEEHKAWKARKALARQIEAMTPEERFLLSIAVEAEVKRRAP